ncbi:hypothetical protein EIP91_002713 [Steccherinum ochraceum]|uniref:Uncharacterized protein n=1 Tax=Steccherinum ochraceum TaxID=92696 RepID=A0A4R0RSF6_9APHY|nr:hypothetical protein EIP91_002713 [Steccherinum ochraceum]
MRSTLPRFVRIIPRSQLKTEVPSGTVPRIVPQPHRSDTKPPSLIELMQKRKEEAGTSFPANIRIEPVLSKKVLRNVSPEIRDELRELLRER